MQKISKSNFTGICLYFSVLNILPRRKVFNSEEASQKSAKTSIARAFNYVLVLKCPSLIPLLVCKFQALFQKPLKEKYGAFCIYNA